MLIMMSGRCRFVYNDLKNGNYNILYIIVNGNKERICYAECKKILWLMKIIFFYAGWKERNIGMKWTD